MWKKKLVVTVTSLMLACGMVSNIWAAETEQNAEEIDVVMPEVSEESNEESDKQEVSQPEAELDTGDSANSIEMEKTIHDNIYLGGVNLSGMNKEEALAAVKKRMDEITGYEIILQMEDVIVPVSAKELGVSGDNDNMINQVLQVGQSGNVISRFKIKKDLEKDPLQLSMEYTVDENMVKTAVETYCVPNNREAKDYGLVRENEKFRVVDGQRGFQVKVEDSVSAITDYLKNTWKDGNGEIRLPLEIQEPKGSYEQLSRVSSKLGSGSTDYSSSGSGRAANVQNATQLLNGTVLYPGDTLSVLDSITPFTEENGYKKAASYANGTTVETFGGGICQVSTTLYLAAIQSELEIVERHNHSMMVGYVKPSMDAAIAEGVKDFKFKNNLEAPVYIEGYASGGKLGFAIYGEEYRPEGRTVKYESETLSTTEPDTVLVGDSGMAYGAMEKIQSPHKGCNAKLWKIVTENGETTRTEFNKSAYNMSPTKYKVGTKTENPQGLAAINQAIAANDIHAVQAAKATYPVSAPAPQPTQPPAPQPTQPPAQQPTGGEGTENQ